jgi:hypothetical protein
LQFQIDSSDAQNHPMKYIRLSMAGQRGRRLPRQKRRRRTAFTDDEFIFETAPFPESHASTIAETPSGFVAAWFGGTKERNPDVGIWVSRL